MTVPGEVKLARHFADLDDDGHEEILTSVTAETDTTLVLAPDGAGGVTFISLADLGAGTITPGAISTVTDDSKYNAWPVVIKLADDSLMLGYTKGDSHHSDNTGKAVKKVSTDNGTTWSSETTIYDDASDWVSLTGLTVMASGRIIASLFQDHVGSGLPVDGAWIVYSTDSGSTWSSPIKVNSSLTSYSYGSGRAMETTGHDLLQCVEGKNSGDTYSSMVVLRSTDNGATWGSQVTIASGTRNYYEACLGLLDASTIMVLLRTSDGSGDIYRSLSTDDGVTWTAPALAFAGHGQPNWVKLSGGTIIAITRENDGSLQGDVWMYTSTDDGASWSAATTLDGTMYEMEYGYPVELATGDVLVVYGYQPSSAITNADIKQIAIAIGTPPLDFAPSDVDYLVGTASGSLSSEIVVGTTPGGELGGTWASPTVDTVHSGSSHASLGTHYLVIASSHSTPLVFGDIVQTSDGSDLIYTT